MTPRNALGLFADAPIKGTTPASAWGAVGLAPPSSPPPPPPPPGVVLRVG
jgi:hypothetical protein